MLLPPELLTIVFLTGFTAVRAQVDESSAAFTHTPAPDLSSAAATPSWTPSPFPTGDSNDIGAPSPVPTASEPPPEESPSDGEYPCDLPDPPDWCDPPDFVQPELPTATGWDDWGEWNNDNIGGGAPSTSWFKPSQTPIVITTNTPTVIEIRTSVEPVRPTGGQGAPQPVSSGQGSVPEGSPAPAPAPPPPPQEVPTSGAPTPAQPTTGPGSYTADVPVWKQTAPSGNDLLDTIINQLGKAQPGAQPAQAPPAPSGEHVNQLSQPTAPADQEHPTPSGDPIADSTRPTTAPTPPPHALITIANTLALGSTTLALTPGLSTTIGTGTDTTLIAIQTDPTSRHTLITLSSSGTAITATITNAPATITLPKTGFEASITGSAGRKADTPRASDSGVSTTSSRGAASPGRTGAMSGWAGCVVVALGLLS